LENTIKVENISKAYGEIQALNKISFSTKKGDIIALLGPNGAGKSTAMKIISGFINADSGNISILGFNVQKQTIKAQEKIGYMHETCSLYPEMTVFDFINFISQIRKIKKAYRKDRIIEICKQAGITEVLNQKISTLSKGYTRRVCLAQAILHDPEIIILDEPTEGLDPNQKFIIRELITNIGRNKTIIISTHIMEEVEAICNHVLLINHGKIITNCSVDELKNKTKDKNIETAFRELTLKG
jgi:ABC-2 type transport system ATP-binding protein